MEDKKCICPSGDGSLRWPCPVHPLESASGSEPARNERAKIVKEIATTMQRQLETASASAAERNENALAGLLSALSSQAHLILAVEGRFERRAALAHQSPSIDQQGGALDDAIRKSAILVNGIWYVPMHAIAHRPIAPANLPEVLPEDVLRYAMECSGRNNPDGARLVRTIYHFIRECLTAPSPSAEDDQDAKDADRYRWLLEDPANVTWGDFYDRTSHGPNWSVSDAIDAAMSQAKGAGKKEDDPRVRELIEAARPFTSGDIVDETSGTTHLMARLQSAIEEFDNE